MSAVLSPPRPPSRVQTSNAWPPRPKRFTVTEFHRLASLGLFSNHRPFLLDGIIWEQEPMNPPHADGIVLVNEALRTAFGSGFVIRPQLPLQIDEFNDPMPDLAVVPGDPRSLLGKHPTTAALVVEVSDTTLSTDLTEKAERYATARVEEYWVLDLAGRRLLVHRDPTPLPAGLGATAYRKQQILGPADRIAPLAAPNSAISVSDLLP